MKTAVVGRDLLKMHVPQSNTRVRLFFNYFKNKVNQCQYLGSGTQSR